MDSTDADNDPEQAKDYRFDILDVTKVWPHSDISPIEVGKMVLNRNPEIILQKLNRLLSIHRTWCQVLPLLLIRCSRSSFLLS